VLLPAAARWMLACASMTIARWKRAGQKRKWVQGLSPCPPEASLFL